MDNVEIESEILTQYPKRFNELFIQIKKEEFPTTHIIEELELFKDNIHNQLTKCNTNLGMIYTDKILKLQIFLLCRARNGSALPVGKMLRLDVMCRPNYAEEFYQTN